MIRSIMLALSLVVLLFSAVRSQEVIITGFPLGVGSGIDSSFFEPYYPQLQSLANTLRSHPLAQAIITGGADGVRYYRNHDSQNSGLALSRAHALRNLLVSRFNVDSSKIIIQSNNVKDKGDPYRYASVRMAWELTDLKAQLDSLAQRPPVERQVTEIKEISRTLQENMGLQLGIGFSSSPFGGIPILTGAITWKRFVFVEGLVGHTFWSNSFRLGDTDLDTRRRIAGGQAYIYPLKNIPVGIVGGWIRIEEISQRYNEYVKMSEGPVLGLRVTPFDFVSITAVHNPAKHNIAGYDRSKLRDYQLLVSATIHIVFGGGK